MNKLLAFIAIHVVLLVLALSSFTFVTGLGVCMQSIGLPYVQLCSSSEAKALDAAHALATRALKDQ